jgi:hypothetical protein
LTTCTNTVGGRTCGPCPSGYSGSGETGCSDINECTTLFNPCVNNGDTAGQCHNTSGSYYCVCSSGSPTTAALALMWMNVSPNRATTTVTRMPVAPTTPALTIAPAPQVS